MATFILYNKQRRPSSCRVMGCVIFVRGAGVSHTIEPGCQLEFELSGARPGVASLHCNIISSKHADSGVHKGSCVLLVPM